MLFPFVSLFLAFLFMIVKIVLHIYYLLKGGEIKGVDDFTSGHFLEVFGPWFMRYRLLENEVERLREKALWVKVFVGLYYFALLLFVLSISLW